MIACKIKQFNMYANEEKRWVSVISHICKEIRKYTEFLKRNCQNLYVWWS